MSKNYKHKTTGQPCNAAQYIAEMVCLREAEKENVGRPAYALWNTEKWKKKFLSQVTKAYMLLKKYSERAIINALNSSQGKNIYSLRVKFLESIIRRQETYLEERKKNDPLDVDYKDNTLSKPNKPFGKKSKRSQLKNLDDRWRHE